DDHRSQAVGEDIGVVFLVPFDVLLDGLSLGVFIVPVFRGVLGIKEGHQGAVGHKGHDAVRLVLKGLQSPDPDHDNKDGYPGQVDEKGLGVCQKGNQFFHKVWDFVSIRVLISMGFSNILWMGQALATASNCFFCFSSKVPINSMDRWMIVFFSSLPYSSSRSIFTSSSSHCLRSAKIFTVAEVQAAREEANSSFGEKPRSFPPILVGSSAISRLPEG